MPDASTHRSYDLAALAERGWTPRRLTLAVRDGRIIRARGGRYLPPDCPDEVVTAVHVGGRLACVSALALLGVWVRSTEIVHVHVRRGSSRLRSAARLVCLHWRPLSAWHAAEAATVGVFDALVQAVRCQPPRDVVAIVDSALNRRLLHPDRLDELFRRAGASRMRLARLVDGRAESGTETLVRLMARALGAAIELQVRIDGVGRVDLVLDGWLVVECDSRAHHSEWATQRNDRRRDQALATLGYCVYRPIAEDILFHPDQVVAALRGLLSSRRLVRNSA